MLYGSDARCLKESEMGVLQRTERSMVVVVGSPHQSPRCGA